MFVLYLRAQSLSDRVLVGQVVTERNRVYLLFSGEQDNAHYDALSAVEGEEFVYI